MTETFPNETHASPNFTWAELGVTDLKKTPKVIKDRLVRLCNSVLEPTRAHFGGKAYHTHSGYRSTDHQAQLWAAEVERCGSVAAALKAGRVAPPGSSRHETGEAHDGHIEGVSPAELAAFHRTLPAVGGSGIYDSFAHVDIRPRRAGRVATW